jgi:CBS domain containing-hemolysin-like protein
MITMEDVLEQIFGEIEDEFDPVYQLPSLDAMSVEVEGTIPIHDLDTQYGIELPDDHEFETLAGFLLYELGRIPKQGDVVEHEKRRYTVMEMAHNRIAKVRIDRLSPPDEDDAQDDDEERR